MRGEPAGLVDGLPTTVKDLLLAKGWPTLRGSRTDRSESTLGRRQRRGRTHARAGRGVPRQDHDAGVRLEGRDRQSAHRPHRQPLGRRPRPRAAAAAARRWQPPAEWVCMHIATDGGGSIRIPAGFCGLFGFKPTFGVVPVHPHPPPWTLWHQGPISRTVHDAALMLTVISRPDVRDFYAAPPLGIDYREGLDDGIRGMRIAYSRTLGYATVDTAVAALVDKAVADARTARRPGRGDRSRPEGPDRGHAPAVGRRAGNGRAAAQRRAAQPHGPAAARPGRARFLRERPGVPRAGEAARDARPAHEPAAPAVRPAGHTATGHHRVRREPRSAAGQRHEALVGMVALHLPVQSHPAACRDRARAGSRPTGCRWRCRSWVPSSPSARCCARRARTSRSSRS